MRRVYSVSAIATPRVQVPPTARKRRRRNRSPFHLPTTAIRRVVLSARWISLFLLLLCVSSLSLIGLDEGFYLTVIPVEGVASIPPAEIVNTSGLAGAHIFAVNPGAAADRIATLPGVISATVTLEWPNVANIRIKEDSPLAVWNQDGQQYWINEKGQLIPARIDIPTLLHIQSRAVVQEAQPATLETSKVEASMFETSTYQENLPAEGATSGAPLFVPEDVLQGALQLRELRPNIDSLDYDPSGGLSYQDGRGWRAYFGTGQNMGQKLIVYETIVDTLLEREETPVYISVSNQEKPFYLTQSGRNE
jgi:cell division septal protein FtsQ